MADRPLPPHVLAAIERGRLCLDRDGKPATKRQAGHARIRVAPKEDRTVDGILFASKREARRYRELHKIRLNGLAGNGPILWFLRQVPFHLPGNTKYLLDFMIFWRDGRVTYEDVKGHRTEMYKLKKRQVEALYPITITEV